MENAAISAGASLPWTRLRNTKKKKKKEMNEAEKQQTAEGLTTGYCVSLLHYYFYFSSGGFVKALKEFSVRCLSDSSIGPRSAPDADVSIFIQILYYDN